MGNDYRKSAHTTFRIELHLVWVTKYRYKILSGSVSPDHVHLLVSLDPSVSVSTLLRQLKGKTSHHLQLEFPELKKRYWGQHLWARGYFAVSVGNVSTPMVQEYIQHHFENKEDSKDPFRVEKP